MRPSVIARYLPRGPEKKLAKALLYAKNPNKRVPEAVGAMEAADKSLESNVFAKILAARPKTDAHTRLILPKSLLNKISVTDQGVCSVVSHLKVVKGQRGYISMVAPLDSRHKRIILKKPRYQNVPVSKSYPEDVANVNKSDLQQLMHEYLPEGPLVLGTQGQQDLGVPSIKTSLNVPALITVGKNQSGLRLAQFVFCQTYLQDHPVR